MRARALVPVTAMVLVVACGANGTEETVRLRQEVARLEGAAGPPPISLDSLYPPVAAAPVYLQAMLGLGEAFTGIVVDFSEQDVEHLEPGFERFRDRYAAATKMVPEWADKYPVEPVDRLGAALASGEPQQIGDALGAVGAVCNDCHVATMAKVQYRYHWGDFSRITVADAAAGRQLSYPELMQELDVGMVGIGIDLEEGQPDRALAHFDAFRSRFGQLAAVCGNCHATERKYFVDATAWETIERLGAALRGDAADPQQVGTLLQRIGLETCHRCHLVHAPAALAARQWGGR